MVASDGSSWIIDHFSRSSPKQRFRPSHRGWRHSLVAFLIVLVSLAILVPVGVAIANAAEFGRFAFWATPSRVNFCGRRYNEQGPESGGPSSFLGVDTDKIPNWKQVDSTFTGRPFYAVEAARAKPGSVCAMVLYLHAGNGQWIVYPLSGGP
jgi:hypothetical protein